MFDNATPATEEEEGAVVKVVKVAVGWVEVGGRVEEGRREGGEEGRRFRYSRAETRL